MELTYDKDSDILDIVFHDRAIGIYDEEPIRDAPHITELRDFQYQEVVGFRVDHFREVFVAQHPHLEYVIFAATEGTIHV